MAQQVSSGIPLIIRSSKTVFAASGLYAHMVTGHCQCWAGNHPFPAQPWQRPVNTCVCKPEAANTVLELLMMSGMPLETCWGFNKLWNNKFYYKAASCWYFYWVKTPSKCGKIQQFGFSIQRVVYFSLSTSSRNKAVRINSATHTQTWLDGSQSRYWRFLEKIKIYC